MKFAASMTPAKHIKRRSLKGMARPNDGYLIGIVVEMMSAVVGRLGRPRVAVADGGAQDRRSSHLAAHRAWSRAGVLESGELQETDKGTPQGAGISPLLANIFLHYILDLWTNQWPRRRAHGRIVIVRYADDFVMGFERRRKCSWPSRRGWPALA
ncbi:MULTISPECIES: reverse transcriptase domain-containing protein [unclassified Bradyrhizobium]|uniref:reverse transcriptase domain-containing protein n=1 Tax=unclassified Bradyrhizobium TaxID=2631580 RepID=UPI001FFAE420|nr:MULTISPECIES: reverse transcriptase domain-containing protein [unclassified Bradyrhizobium]